MSDNTERRDEASLCHSCARHRPGQVDNCRIEFYVTQTELDHQVKLTVDGCPQYVEIKQPKQ